MYGLKSAVFASFLTLSMGASAAPVTMDLDNIGFENNANSVAIQDQTQDRLVFKPQQPSQVPEPGTWALLGLALTVLGMKRLRKPKSENQA